MTLELDKHESVTDAVKDYYGKVLQSSKDLKTNACCSADAMPRYHKDILAKIEPEVLAKFYGCGTPLPSVLEGCTVLDLGSGSGRDAYLASALVGPEGKVIGLDMTDEQLDVARRHQDAQAKAFGHEKSNVTFVQGYIEDLKAAGIEDNSVDVVISNCVINLSPDKEAVFKEIFRVLKPGGEMYISDVFADRRVPKHLREDPVLHGECLTGAMYIEDFRRLLTRLGCADYRQMSNSKITIENEAIEEKAGHIGFYSITVRAFKLDCLEDQCEDFGQFAEYLGTDGPNPVHFTLDDHHVFETGRPMAVCGNTAAMLEETRFGKHFRISGNRENHFGLFDCGPSPAGADCGDAGAGGACC